MFFTKGPYKFIFTIWMLYPYPAFCISSLNNNIDIAYEIIQQMNAKYLTCRCKNCEKSKDGQCTQKECNGIKINFALEIRNQWWVSKNYRPEYKIKKNKIKGILTVEKENIDNLTRYKLNVSGLYDIRQDGHHRYYKDKGLYENEEKNENDITVSDCDVEDEETEIILKLKDIIINTTEILHVVYYTKEKKETYKKKHKVYFDCIELELNKEHKRYNGSEEEEENPDDSIERVYIYINPKTKDLIKLEIIMESRVLYVIEIEKIDLCVDTSHPSFFKFDSAKRNVVINDVKQRIG